jgi:GT2 family glycosyltransferase
MPEPLVSVIIPTFRREAMLVEAVRSSLDQPGVAVEVLVLDDSPEGSAEAAVREIGDPRVRYVHREVPSGGHPAVVRNDGLALACGEYLHFLDDDDMLVAGSLAAAAEALERTPSAGVTFGLIMPFGDDPDAVERERRYFTEGAERLSRMRSRLRVVAEMLFRQTPLVNSAFTIRADCARALGGYSRVVRFNEDVDFYLRAIRRFGYVRLDRPVVHYRVGHASLMHSLTDFSVLQRSYRDIYVAYRRSHGRVEFELLRAYGAAVRLAARVRGRLSPARRGAPGRTASPAAVGP